MTKILCGAGGLIAVLVLVVGRYLKQIAREIDREDESMLMSEKTKPVSNFKRRK